MTLVVNLLRCSALSSAMALAACGGGGADAGDPAPGPSAEGVYGGTLTGSASSAFQLLVLENGEFWSMYGTRTPTLFGVAGFVQGSGSSSNGSFTSSNTKDFGFAPALSASTRASYDATAKTISGTFSTNAGAVTFSGGPVAGSLYDYNAAASLTKVSGSWSAISVAGETVALNINAGGAVTATSSRGCSFSGVVAPRPSGKNVFNVSLTFGAAPCALAGQAATGIAVAYPLPAGRTQLLVSVVDSTRTYGTAVFGTR